MSLTVFELRVNSFDAFNCRTGLYVNNGGVLPQRPAVTLRETYCSRTDTSKKTLTEVLKATVNLLLIFEKLTKLFAIKRH